MLNMASRTPGRPRSRSVDDAILRAAGELLRDAGVEGTTINAVARRSGVARASIYLRPLAIWAIEEALRRRRSAG